MFGELPRKAGFGGFKEGELMLAGAIEQGFPVGLGGENQAKVPGINPFLRCWWVLGEVSHELMPVQVHNQGVARLSPQVATESIAVELLRLLDVGDGKGEVKQDWVCHE